MEVYAQATEPLQVAVAKGDDPQAVQTACRFLALLLAATLFLPSTGLLWRFSASVESLQVGAQTLACHHCREPLRK